MTSVITINVALTSIVTALMAFLTFKHVRASTYFRDFMVLIFSLMVAVVASLIVPLSEGPLLPLTVILLVNGLWLYGVEPKTSPKRYFTIDPAVPRVFIGLILLMIASWLAVSSYNVSIALIIVLVYVMLGAYKGRELTKPQ